MKLKLIWAESIVGAFGAHGQLPWDNQPADMAHFKHLTTGCVVIMGKRTWDSLPPRSRPLPGRINIVLTRTPRKSPDTNVFECGTFLGALDRASIVSSNHSLPDFAWVIGGRAVFDYVLEHHLPMVEEIHVSVIQTLANGDVMAPSIPDGYYMTSESPDKNVVFRKYIKMPAVQESPSSGSPLERMVTALTNSASTSVGTSTLSEPADAPVARFMAFVGALSDGVDSGSTSEPIRLLGGVSILVSDLIRVRDTLVEMREEKCPMKFDPMTGQPAQPPFSPTAYRKHHGKVAWLFNPWTGVLRTPQDIGSDVEGLLLDPTKAAP